MEDDATQPSTQQILDPRRLGRNNSGLSAADVADVICILHPASPAAFRIVAHTFKRYPQHVLQNDAIDTFAEEVEQVALEEQETFVINSDPADTAHDLALRFSSRTVQPVLGFCFGRSPKTCDIVIDTDSQKRVSNLHFRIYVNNTGVLMLEDMSTNGTLVDDKHLKGKAYPDHNTRMLQGGSVIQIPSINPEESIKFIVRLPSRAGYQMEYTRNLQQHLRLVMEAERRYQADHARNGYNQMYAVKNISPPSNPFGMHWDGGEEFNVVGLLGKGAFATVYKLATKLDGQYYAAKELEKKRFIKNGRLDQRLDNELQIMKSTRHDNIVRYINYQDHAEHLYIIMEFVPCGDLQGYLSVNAVLPETEAKLMSRQVLDALHYLHGKQITHRDIKPDNILIADEDPFTIKLSDFGLSKVVKSHETFLKTFCGTLLYCAPEVFPHYDDHISQKGVKRRRSGGAGQKFHSYSQSVDIWSYAAVLWLSLCNKPPFEGVVDNTGRGMFNKIMETRLDITPLIAHGVSADAIDLMTRMLNTDPSKRPTEVECIQHTWLYDGRKVTASQAARGLGAIQEEEEGAPSVEGQVQKLSQLSVNDQAPVTAGAARQLSNLKEEDEEAPQFDSGDFDFLDPRQSKRFKVNQVVPQRHVPDQAAISSSPELDDLDLPDSPVIPKSTPKQNRIFGEIGDSALESSGVLDNHARIALAMESYNVMEQSNGSKMSIDASGISYQARQTSDLHRSDSDLLQHPSLMGTESMVREMQMMETPGIDPAVSGDASDDAVEPQTPKSPGVSIDHSQHTKSPVSQQQRHPSSTTLQRDQRGQRSLLADDGPPTEQPELGDRQNDFVPSTLPHTGLSAGAIEESASQGYLGVLTTTPDSFRPFTIHLKERSSGWGRAPKNAFVYPDIYDTRIAKRAWAIWFHAWRIDQEIQQGRDWRIMPGLHTIISTDSSVGIWVNGVHLAAKDSDGEQLCGRLYSGDIITVYKGRDRELGTPPEHLSFVCEFHVGEAEDRRPEDLPFVPIRAIEPSQQRSSF